LAGPRKPVHPGDRREIQRSRPDQDRHRAVELQKWLAGDYHVPSKASVPIPPGFLGRWTQQELALVKIYLESIDPLAMELEDWSLVIDFLVQRYMPLELLLEEGEWLATKAQLMGRVQAHTGTMEAGAASAIAEALPGTVAGAQAMFAYSDAEAAILSFGKESCCDAIVSLTEDMRHRLRRVVLDHQRRKLAGEEVDDKTLESQLFDKFDSLNRDWRRIAVTEAGEMANQGVIAHMDPGTHVRRLEMYHGACAFCRSLDGRVFRVTTASMIPRRTASTTSGRARRTWAARARPTSASATIWCLARRASACGLRRASSIPTVAVAGSLWPRIRRARTRPSRRGSASSSRRAVSDTVRIERHVRGTSRRRPRSGRATTPSARSRGAACSWRSRTRPGRFGPSSIPTARSARSG
jgi:hypothetical protein